MKVSIVIPVWNVAPFMSRCFNSVRRQTHDDLEIILVNDGSTDGSGDIGDALAREDRRIRVIHQPNQGVSATRNAGMDAASGEYLLFLDGDDTLAPDAVEVLLRAITSDHADMVICGHRRISYAADGRIVSDATQKAARAGTFTRKEFLRRFAECDYLVYIGWEYCWDRIISRAFLRRHNLRFPAGMTLCEDRIFDLQCLAVADIVSVIPQALCCHFLPVGQPAQAFRSASTRADESRWLAHQESFDQLYRLLAENDGLTDDVCNAIRQDYVNTMVVAVYRICRTDASASLRERMSLVGKICRHPMMRKALRTYASRSSRECRIMPFLMRFGGSLAVTLFAMWKARKIYG